MRIKFNYIGVKKFVQKSKTILQRNHISDISLLSNTEIVMSFSFYRKEKLFISLKQDFPFLEMVDCSPKLPKFDSNFLNILKKEIKDSYIIDIQQLNEDRIISFELISSDLLKGKVKKFLIFECFNKKARLIILNEDYEIYYSNHFDSLLDEGRIVKGKKYILPKSNPLIDNLDFDPFKFKSEISKYFYERLRRSIVTKHQKLFSFFTSRPIIISRKIEKLNQEILDNEMKLEYRIHGDNILTLDGSERENYVQNHNIKYDSSKSVYQNAEDYYKIYKKAKNSLLHIKENIDLAKKEIGFIDDLRWQLNSLNENDLIGLEQIIFKNNISKEHNNKQIIKNSKTPYFIKYKNTKILFGRNDVQNDTLTFSLAKSDHIFFHIHNFSGPHVVIFSSNPSKSEIDIACDIAVFLANKSQGEVMSCSIKDIKRTKKIGQVMAKKFTLYRVDNIEESTKALLSSATKYS